MYHILLVEDDKRIREVIEDYIDEKGKDVMRLACAADGENFWELLERQTFDLILLDVMLPDTDGFVICRRLRQKSAVPIVFLTARGREEDVLWGYGLGCDDYIVKPFSLATLYVKMLAILRRTNQPGGMDTLVCGRIRMEKKSCRVYVDEEEICLQNKQYEVLRFLMEHPDVVWSRDVLLNRIWGYDYIGVDRVVDNQIKKLRQALGAAGGQIRTVVGQGYRMENE